MTPAEYAKSGTEHGEQTAVMMWCALNRIKYPELNLLFAIPNGGARGKAEAVRLKAEGVKAGVSDLFLPVARGPWHGLFIEMKAWNGRLSIEQKRFGYLVGKQGYKFEICRGWEVAVKILVDYLELKIMFDNSAVIGKMK